MTPAELSQIIRRIENPQGFVLIKRIRDEHQEEIAQEYSLEEFANAIRTLTRIYDVNVVDRAVNDLRVMYQSGMLFDQIPSRLGVIWFAATGDDNYGFEWLRSLNIYYELTEGSSTVDTIADPVNDDEADYDGEVIFQQVQTCFINNIIFDNFTLPSKITQDLISFEINPKAYPNNIKSPEVNSSDIMSINLLPTEITIPLKDIIGGAYDWFMVSE